MRRVLIRRPGHYDRLEIVEEPDPQPGPDEVVVATEAVGVNYADCIVRMGLYSSAKKYVGWPITPGFDFAGHICSVGRAVTQWQVGDPIVGVTRFGGYASRVRVPVSQVFALPKGWTMARAAAFPTVHLTAWYALCELSRPRPGKKVLVHSAAGGVGTAALAICRHLGLDAFAVVGASHKVEAARRELDRSSEALWEKAEAFAPEGFDIILEASGASTLRQSYRHLCPTGRLLIYGMATLLTRGGKRINWFRVAWQYLRLPWFHPMSLLAKSHRHKDCWAHDDRFLAQH